MLRKPAGIKIDTYIAKYGDRYGYPTLIEGAETIHQDVGGLPGYDEFLERYYNESHPEHGDAKAWAEEQLYKEYDENHINRDALIYKV